MYSIILIDDEPNTYEVLAEFIQAENIGFEVVGCFDDGQKAWDYLKNNPVDCVITDISMPNMDGLELARNIYQNGKNTKVILLSGYREFEYAKRGIQYGVVDYQCKPIDYDNIADVLVKIKNQFDDNQKKVNVSKRTDSLQCFSSVAIEKAIRYLNEHYHELISRENVARICFMDPSYFGICFKEQTGYTFTDYLTMIRIEHSKELLYKNMLIEDVASSVGYGSSRHFGRVFKDVTGYTPKEYKMKILNQEIEH